MRNLFFSTQKNFAGGFSQKQALLAEKKQLLVKKLVNLPDIAVLLSNMGEYAKIEK